jgi:Protein of unknown function (DUF3435)
MGHENARTYEKYYANLRVQCDVQNAFLGLPSDDRLLAVASRVGRSADPRRPSFFEMEWWEEIVKESLKLRVLLQARQTLRATCISQFGRMRIAADAEHKGLPNAELRRLGDSAMRALDDENLRDEQPTMNVPYQGPHARYEETRRRLKNLTHCLKREWLERKRETFNKSAPIDDIQRQLNGLPSTILEHAKRAAPINFARSNLAAQLFEKDLQLLGSDVDIQRRLKTLNDLLSHCALREPRSTARRIVKTKPHYCEPEGLVASDSSAEDEDEDCTILPYINSSALGDHQSNFSPTCDKTPLVLEPTICLHCLFHGPYSDRRWEASRFSRKDAMQRHAERAHFRQMKDEQSTSCPHELCADKVFDDLNHFKNHALAVHKIAY